MEELNPVFIDFNLQVCRLIVDNDNDNDKNNNNNDNIIIINGVPLWIKHAALQMKGYKKLHTPIFLIKKANIGNVLQKLLYQGEYELIMMYEEQEDKRFSPKKSASWELIDLDNTDKVEYLIPIL